MLIDSHCHLTLLEFTEEQPNLESVLKECEQQQITHLLSVATNLKDFSNLLNIARKYKNISISAGIHPNETSETNENKEEKYSTEYNNLLKQAQNTEVIAIGETGLDYYRTEENQTWQHDRFIHHIDIAKKLKKPLIIHTRNAADDTINILKNHAAGHISGIMHCFTEDWEIAKQALDLGFYISISGIVTFKNATQVQDVAKKVPIDRLLIETDCPYLAPIPHRGKINFPQYVKYTAVFIAQLRNIAFEEIAQQTSRNFYRLFENINH